MPNHLLFIEHPPGYTLSKRGSLDHLLIDEAELKAIGALLCHESRSRCYHSPEQLVGYPILDLENFIIFTNTYDC